MSSDQNTKVGVEQGGDAIFVKSSDGGTIKGQSTAGAAVSQSAHIADPAAAAAITTDLTGVDTGTDMTAAQAAQIEADLAALKTAIDANNAAIDSILVAIERVGITAKS